MLDDFKDNSFYKYAINLKKYYHAYLFEVDDIDKSYPLIKAFAKMIICNNHYTNNTMCNNCNICHLIDNNSYQDFKVIETSNSSIKKEDILKVQKELSLKSLNNTNQVYIIKEAEKMNSSASNSLLKFLEEPEEGIYGILVTTNRKALLETIISRCILITLKMNNEINLDNKDITNLVNFIKKIYIDREKTIPYLKQEFFKYYETREDIIKAFNIMENIIDIMLKYNYKIIDKEVNNYDIIYTNLSNINEKELIIILDKIVIYKNKLTNVLNLNINLFMDRFIIDISEALK